MGAGRSMALCAGQGVPLRDLTVAGDAKALERKLARHPELVDAPVDEVRALVVTAAAAAIAEPSGGFAAT